MVTAHVSAHQEFQGSQEALDPRNQRVPRDHPAITDLKDLWALEETRAMKAQVGDEVLQALCVWESGSVIALVLDLLTQQQAGTQCPESTWKKYYPHRLETTSRVALVVVFMVEL